MILLLGGFNRGYPGEHKEMRQGFAAKIFARFATTASENHANHERAIGPMRIPWPGNPRVNIQTAKGKAKSYQLRQVLLAMQRLENDNG